MVSRKYMEDRVGRSGCLYWVKWLLRHLLPNTTFLPHRCLLEISEETMMQLELDLLFRSYYSE